MRHLVLALLMLTACGAVVLAAKDQPSLAAEPGPTETLAGKEAPAPKDPPAKQDQTASKDAGKPVNKFCAIKRDHEIDPAVTTTHEGKTIAFCCPPCIEKFKADPKKYMKDLK